VDAVIRDCVWQQDDDRGQWVLQVARERWTRRLRKRDQL